MNNKILIGALAFILLASVPNVSAWDIGGNIFNFRTPIQNTTDMSSGVQISVNGTEGINGLITWIKSEGNQLYAYCEISGCATGNVTIADVTPTPVEFEIEGATENLLVWDNGVHAWHMNNISTNIPDVVGIYNLTLSGTYEATAGLFGSGIRFKGTTNNYAANIDFDFISGNEAITLFAWGRQEGDSAETWGRLLNIGEGVNDNLHIISRFSDTDPWRWGFGTFGNNQDSDQQMATDFDMAAQIHYANTTTNGFVNGTQFTTAAITFGIPSSPDCELAIGLNTELNGNPWNGTVDEVRVYNWTLTAEDIKLLSDNSLNTAFMFGAEQADAETTITILSPTNDTFWTATDFNISFKVESGINATFNVLALIDGVTIFSDASYVNNTVVEELENISAGVRNLTVFATDDSGETRAEVIFTINDYEIEFVTFSELSFETSNQTYNISIRINPDLISSITSTLFYGGENVGPHDSSFNNATNFNRGKLHNLELIETNNTNFSVIFRNQIFFINSTIITENSTEENQTVVFAYFINEMTTDNIEYLEGANITATTNVSDKVTFADLTAFVEFNITNFTSTLLSGIDPKIYSNIQTAPQIDASPSNNITVTPFLTVSFNGTEFNRTATGANIEIFQITLTNCTTGTRSILFEMFEEINETADNGTLEIAIDAISGAISRNFSFTFASNHSHSICIIPATAEYTVNATVQFQGIDFPTRFYIIVNGLINNITNTINLFMLNEDIGTLISPITVKDSVGNLLDDVVVQFQRFYVGQNKYQLVAMTLTDVNGIGGSFLQMNTVWYRIILLRDGEILRTIEQSLLTETEPVYSTAPLQIITNTDFTTGIDFDCSTTDSFISCLWVDTTGLSSEMCLAVQEVGIVSLVPFNTTCSSSSSAQIMINISSLSAQNKTSRYVFTAVAAVGGNNQTLEIGTHDITPDNPYGILGVILTVFILLPITALGIKKPEAAVVLGGAAIILSVMIGFLDMTLTAIGSLVVVIIIIAYKVARR